MKLVNQSQDGGTSHYTLVPESASDLGQPSEEFRTFVRELNCEPLSAAVSRGQFQHKLEQAFVGGQVEGATRESAAHE